MLSGLARGFDAEETVGIEAAGPVGLGEGEGVEAAMMGPGIVPLLWGADEDLGGAVNGEVGVSGIGFDGGVDHEKAVEELGTADVLVGIEFVGLRDALFAAVGAADGIDFAGGGADGAELRNPAFVVGGDKKLVAVELDAEESRDLFEGGIGGVAVVVGVGVVVDVQGAKQGVAGQLDAIDGAIGMVMTEGLYLRANFRFEFFPTGAPGLPGNEATLAGASKKGGDCFRFEVIIGNNPKSRRHSRILGDRKGLRKMVLVR